MFVGVAIVVIVVLAILIQVGIVMIIKKKSADQSHKDVVEETRLSEMGKGETL